MNDLVTWLRVQLDEDERVAREAADRDSGRWFFGDKWNVYRAEDIGGDDGEINQLVVYGNVKPQSEHIARQDPARVLREVEAKRLIVAWCVRMDPEPNVGGILAGEARRITRWLALPYADRDGYREEWRP